MKQAAQPYLHFDSDCKIAMEYYKELFGGELNMMSIKESPMKDQFPEAIHEQIMHAHLNNDNFNLMASDMCGMGEVQRGNWVEISLNCSSESEIKQLYERLSKDGEILQELKPQFWGALFAMVIDRFGVRWMLSLDKENE